MHVSPWILLGLAVPVLILGESLVRRIGVLSRFNIPAPVVGGLLVSILVLVSNIIGTPAVLDSKVTAKFLTWLVLPEPQWLAGKAVGVGRPFLIGFFACIGLNASALLVRRASWRLPLFLSISALLTILQNGVGVAIATAVGESPLLGLLCGSISLTGGHGTALGFADVMVQAGYEAAPVVGVAAATFGLVAAGLLGGPVGGRIIRSRGMSGPKLATAGTDASQESSGPLGVLGELRLFVSSGRPAWVNLVVLLFCIKTGAWVSLAIQQAGLTFPVYIGAMLVGIVLRNISDFSRLNWITTKEVNLLGDICLGLFLSIAMMGLNLIELAASALPMLAILVVQVIVMGFFARWITFTVMGRDYDAAVMAGGHCGFGLGATPAAVANMKALTEVYGAAPRAFLILPLVGAFLIDFVNALVITTFLNFVK